VRLRSAFRKDWEFESPHTHMEVDFLARYYWNRIFWTFARPIRKTFRYFRPPKGRAVKVIINDGTKIVFAGINYSPRLWTIPGGGVARNETFEDAARREVWEELGLHIGSLSPAGEYLHPHEYGVFQTKVF